MPWWSRQAGGCHVHGLVTLCEQTGAQPAVRQPFPDPSLPPPSMGGVRNRGTQSLARKPSAPTLKLHLGAIWWLLGTLHYPRFQTSCSLWDVAPRSDICGPYAHRIIRASHDTMAPAQMHTEPHKNSSRCTWTQTQSFPFPFLLSFSN